MKKPKMTARQWWMRQRRIMRRLIGRAERGEVPANVALYRVRDAAESRISPSRSKVWVYSGAPVLLPTKETFRMIAGPVTAGEADPDAPVLRIKLFGRFGYDDQIPSPGAGGGQW